MEDVRCPMCGRPNPAEFEVCKYCQARLKPLRLTPDESTEESTSKSSSGLTDWLRSLEEESEPQPQKGEEHEEQLGWLKDLRGEAEEGFELPGEDTEHIVESVAHQPDEDEASDWLDHLRKAEDLSASEEPQEAFLDEALLFTSDKDESEPLPDWLAELRQSPEGEEQTHPVSPEEEISPAISETQQPEPLAEEISKEEFEAHLSASLQTDESGPSSESEGEEFSEEWVLELPEEGETPEEESGFESEIPEWLLEEEETPAEETVDEAEAFPLEPPGVEEELLAESSTGTEEELEAIETGEPVEESPQLEFSDEGADEREEAEPSIDEFETADTETQEKEASEAPISGIQLPDWLVETSANVEGEGGPDWLYSVPEPLDVSEESIPLPEEAISDEGEFVEQPLSEVEEELPIERGEIPEWLEEIESEEIQPQEEAPPEKREGETEEGGGLEQAEIPGWLKSKQPIESVTEGVAMDEDEERVEPAGPLAGLKGVLPAEPEISLPRKPPPYSLKIQVSERQQQNANLLKSIVESEGKASPLPEKARLTPQNVFRIAVALLLMLSVLLPLTTGLPSVGSPSPSESVLSVNATLDKVTLGTPVLFVVDYQAGFSGEMDAITSAVMDHLMIRGAYIVLASNTPVGAVQAERLVASTNNNFAHDYQSPGQYINLGYIPGGVSGVLSFVEQPRITLPLSLDGTLAWDTPSLMNVHSLSNFFAVVLATENPNVARVWIEQVMPGLETTPLVLLLSAQASPIIQTYVDRQPIQNNGSGMLTSMLDGTLYAQLTGRQGVFSKVWVPFSLAGLMAAALILFAGLVNFVLALIRGANTKDAGGS